MKHLVTLRWTEDKQVKELTIDGAPWVHGHNVDEMEFHRIPTSIEWVSLYPCVIPHGRWKFPGDTWRTLEPKDDK